MQKATQALNNFISHDGEHKTTVHKDSGKAVVDEHIRPHRHEDITTAVDKEVHQDHYQTIVQPLEAKETRAEKHVHNAMPVEHKTYDHRNTDETRSKLNSEAAHFKDASVTHEATNSKSAKPTLTGEHVHHHVHQHVQPVLHKEVVDPTVVHTTQPIHETHHLSSVHHDATILPVKTVNEWTSAGGLMEGHATRELKEHNGMDRPYEGTQAMAGSTKKSQGGINGDHFNKTATTTTTGTNGHKNGLGQTQAGAAATAAAATATANTRTTRAQANEMSKMDSTASKDTTSTMSTGRKPSLLAKLNPFTDADGDGKKGIMH